MKDTSCCWRQRWRHTAQSARRDGRPSVSSSSVAVRQPALWPSLPSRATPLTPTPPRPSEQKTPTEDRPSGMRKRKHPRSSGERINQTRPARSEAPQRDRVRISQQLEMTTQEHPPHSASPIHYHCAEAATNELPHEAELATESTSKLNKKCCQKRDNHDPTNCLVELNQWRETTA